MPPWIKREINVYYEFYDIPREEKTREDMLISFIAWKLGKGLSALRGEGNLSRSDDFREVSWMIQNKSVMLKKLANIIVNCTLLSWLVSQEIGQVANWNLHTQVNTNARCFLTSILLGWMVEVNGHMYGQDHFCFTFPIYYMSLFQSPWGSLAITSFSLQIETPERCTVCASKRAFTDPVV